MLHQKEVILAINIQTKSVTQNKNHFIRANSSTAGNPAMKVLSLANAKEQNNALVDMNYGNLLVKSKKVSFTGLPPSIPPVLPSLTKRINAAVQALEQGEVVLVGKDLENTKKLLKESIGSFNTVIKKLFFIEDPNTEETIAFHKNNRGLNEILNLGKGNIHMEDNIGRHHFIQKGESIYITTDDKIRLKNEAVEFSLNPKEGFDEIRFNHVKPINLREKAKSAIDNTNRKLIEQLEEKKPGVAKKKTFADVGGQDAAILELKKGIIYPLKYPSAYKNSALNHGIILTGGPGTGKSLVAEALANEAEAHYIKLNGLELESKYVGESEDNWRKLFKEAVAKQPTIIFIDEFDAVAKSRKGSETSRHDDKVVNQILTLMSDIEKNNDQVFIVAATNKLSLLDEAVTRSGRFGKHILMGNPDAAGCKKILGIHTKNKPLSEKVDIDKLSKELQEVNSSGADIEFIANDAHQKAFERLKIYEKMEDGTFKDEDADNLKIEPEDFKKAIESFKEKQKLGKDGQEIGKTSRKEEIKNELQSRREAEKELAEENSKNNEAKPKNKIGYTSDLYKKKQ